MLERIRKGTNNIAVKIILWLIALSFLGIGGAGFVGGNDGGDVVTFDKVDSISMQEFQLAKAKEIDAFQRQNNINLTDENIAELDINNAVLRQLIHESMIKYLAGYYDFDISENLVIKLVKNIPYFKNAEGEFDLTIFKNVFQGSQHRENEYLLAVKKDLMRQALFDVFKDSFVPPKIMTENMVKFMAETRIVDLLSIDMTYKPSNYKPEILKTNELEDFYQSNQELFIVPELRSFEYIKVDQAFLVKKLKISEADLKQFFEENKDEFTAKNYVSAKKQVQEILTSEKLEELTNELAKNFEEDVSSGLTLQEIAQKYELKVSSIEEISLSQMNSSPASELIELSDSVFEMIEGELSYPIEVADKNEILLASLKSIVPSRQRSFSEVQGDIENIIQTRALAKFNWQQLNKLQENYLPTANNRDALKAKGIKLVANKSFTRDEIPLQDKLPAALMQSMFSTNKDGFTGVASDDKKLYIAYVKTITTNKSKSKTIRDKSAENFSNTIQDGLFQELLVHLTQKNNIQILQAK